MTSLPSTARALAGMSRRQLASVAGVSPSTVSRIERGEMEPTLAMAERLVAAAGFRLESELVWVSDPLAVAAARAVLDPESGLGKMEGTAPWLDRWAILGLTDRDGCPTKRRELARRAGLSARLAYRPGAKSYLRDRSWADVARGLALSGRAWAATGGTAANRLAPSADAPWPVFYVDDPAQVATDLGLVGTTDGRWPITLIAFDGVADVGIEVDSMGLRWVDPIQVLIDCYAGSDRMPEQADALADAFDLACTSDA